MSDTDAQKRVLGLFDELLDVPPEEREAWLEERTAGEPALRARLSALLAAHETDSGPLDRASPAAAVAARGEPADADDIRERLDLALGDRFALEREIGRGGMAYVFLARERKHDRPVVLKVLRPELRPFLGADRFEREVRIASSMSHPNIIGLLDSGTADGLPFFVMPYVEGETLRARLDREGTLPAAEAAPLLHDVAAALAHAHGRGIVHRDLKPENVLCAGDHAYVMDFGIARPFAETRPGDDLTRPGIALGTPRYMSPEQREGRAVDYRTDIYAWGLLAREMCGGNPPAAWLEVIEACLRDDPDDRPGDAGRLAAAVRPEGVAGASEGAVQRAWPWVAAAAALALLAWGAVVRQDRPPPVLEAAGAPLPYPLAVAPLRNETGDPANDMLGRLAADWIVQGLQRAEVGPVVPWTASLEAARQAGGDDPSDSLAGEFAADLDAGTVISGAIYAIGDRLSFAAAISNARERRVISAIAPITVRADSAEAAIRELRDRILGSLAIEQDPLLGRVSGLSGNPPLLEAYRAYERGHELFEAQDYAEAQAEYERAFGLDTTFLVPKLSAAVAMWNQGNRAGVDSVLSFLGARRDRLSEYHDLRRRALAAQLAGDGEAAFELELRRAEIGPTPLGSYNAANLANELNRPAVALDLLIELDPNGPGLRGWAQYWTQLAHAYHGLARYGEEFDAASEMWARFPERRIATVLAARALSAAGRTADLDSVFASLRLLPPHTYWSLGAAYVVAGEEARAHRADTAQAARLFREAITWLEERLRDRPAERVHRYWLASAYYDLEEFERSAALFAELARDHPDRSEYRIGAWLSRAHLEGAGYVRARRAEMDEPVHGYEFTDAARLEAAGGDGERALGLLAEGLRNGISSRVWLHGSTLPDLGRLADDPRYARALGEIAEPTSPLP